jgi:hypothetical protein
VRADAVFDGFACAAKRLTACVGIDAHIAETGLRGLPLDLGEFLLTAIGQDETRLRPVGPIRAEAIAAIRDDEEEFLRAFEGDIDLDAVVRRLLVDDLGLEERLRRGEDERGSEEGEQDDLHARARVRRCEECAISEMDGTPLVFGLGKKGALGVNPREHSPRLGTLGLHDASPLGLGGGGL